MGIASPTGTSGQWTLMQSACVSGHAHQLRTVRGSHLDLNYWNAGDAKEENDALDARLPPDESRRGIGCRTDGEATDCEETSASSRTIATWVNRLITSEERVLKETLALRK